MSSLKETLDEMRADAHLLRERWGRLRQRWRDPAAEQLEHGLWDPMTPALTAFLKAAEQFADTLERAREQM